MRNVKTCHPARTQSAGMAVLGENLQYVSLKIVNFHQAQSRQVLCTHMFSVIRIFYLELWTLPGYPLKTKQTNKNHSD